MHTCIILCAAGFDGLLFPPDGTDLLIAADGGLAHAQKFGLRPDVILGDFDSLGYAPAGANVFPVEKDDTDAMLAVRHGLSAGYRQFLLYGALDGPRLDHTIANFQTLRFLEENGAWGALIGLNTIVTTIQNGKLTFSKDCTGTISIFALGESAEGVTIENLYYSLENGTLTPNFPLGVSNHFTGKEATISVENGTLTVLFDRSNPLPIRE